MLDEFEVLKIVIDRLDSAGIPYMISGSVAMNYYAQPRMTRDIDIVVRVGPDKVENFYNLFEDDFYIDLDGVREAVESKRIFNIIHLKEVVKIDFIIHKGTKYSELEFERRRKVRIDDFEIFLASPEDLVLSKLLWAKNSHSELQLRDVKYLLAGEMDLGYVKEWSKVLSVERLLKEVLDERH